MATIEKKSVIKLPYLIFDWSYNENVVSFWLTEFPDLVIVFRVHEPYHILFIGRFVLLQFLTCVLFWFNRP